MADFSDMDVDFDEQLGLEDDHLVGFEDEIYVEPPTEVEADADQVVLPVHVNAEDDLMETTEGQVPQESSSLPVAVAGRSVTDAAARESSSPPLKLRRKSSNQSCRDVAEPGLFFAGAARSLL